VADRGGASAPQPEVGVKVTLVNPPTLLGRHALGTMKPTLPLGLAYVAAAAREAGHELQVVDAIARAPHETARDARIIRIGAAPDQIVSAIPDDTQVIGVGCLFSFLWPTVRELLHAIRRRFPDVPIVCGGEHMTAMPELVLEQSPADVIVLGEGEETFVELLAAIERGAGWDRVAGLAVRQAGVPSRTPPRARVRDVDGICWPAWDLFRPEIYDQHDFSLGMRLGFSMPILATRGCPYQCTFCTSPNMWTTRWYARDPADVVDEIESYSVRYGARNFPFHDLTAVIKKHWVSAFAREILRRGLSIEWQLPAGTRCEAFDPELAGLMVASGCRYLAFAPESGSERIRNRIKKHLDRKNLLRAVEVASRAGMHVTCFLMIGLPFDTHEDLADSLDLVRALARSGAEDISCHSFFPSPGSALFRELTQSGRVVADDATLMAPLFNTGARFRSENCFCDNLTAAELMRWRYRIFANFYGLRFARHPGAALRLATNILRDRETNKLEAFAREVRARFSSRRAGARASAGTARSSPPAQSARP
jgi:anaerobic magnesium-protoporphyrin IX monomethyl ester cyclase